MGDKQQFGEYTRLILSLKIQLKDLWRENEKLKEYACLLQIDCMHLRELVKELEFEKARS